MSPPSLLVVACLLQDHRGVLLARRRDDAPDFGGFWEFPGGKVDPGETQEDALAREMQEERGVTISVGEEVWRGLDPREKGPDIDFRVHRCTILAGTPRPLEAAEVAWFFPDSIAILDLPPLDRRLLSDLSSLGS